MRTIHGPNTVLDPGNPEGAVKRPLRAMDSPDTIAVNTIAEEGAQVPRQSTAREAGDWQSLQSRTEAGGSTHPATHNEWGLGRTSMEGGYAARELSPSAGQRITAGTSLQNGLVWGWEDGSMSKVLATQEFRAPEPMFMGYKVGTVGCLQFHPETAEAEIPRAS